METFNQAPLKKERLKQGSFFLLRRIKPLKMETELIPAELREHLFISLETQDVFESQNNRYWISSQWTSRSESRCRGCWVTASNLRLDQPETIHPPAVRSRHLGGLAPLSLILSFYVLLIAPSLLHTLSSLSLHPLFSRSDMPILRANGTVTTQIKCSKQFFCLSSTSYRLTRSLFPGQRFSL